MSEFDPALLEPLFTRLALNTVRRCYAEIERQAQQENWAYGLFLERLLSAEVARRTETRIQHLMRKAGFPFAAPIETFDFSFRPELKRQLLGRFLGPELVSDNRSLILEGPPGTGKTHLCIAIATKAVQNGFRAHFITATALIQQLSQATDFASTLKSFVDPHVLVCDEIGYLGCGDNAADVLFQIVDQRYLKGRPILFTTNKPLRQWGKVLHDEELAKAILDRTLHHGEHLKLSGPSYRLRGKALDLDGATPATSSRST